MTDLLAAATKQIEYAGNEFASGDIKKGQEHLDKAASFIQRAAGSTAEAPPGDSAEEPAEEAGDWSEDRNEAIHQILEETGHPTVLDSSGASVGTDPSAVIVDATAEQIEALTVLGYFGAPGTVAGVDYEPYERYYEQTSDDGQGGIGYAPKADYPTGDAVWAHFLSSRSNA